MNTTDRDNHPDNWTQNKHGDWSQKVNVCISTDIKTPQVRHENSWVYDRSERKPCTFLFIDCIYCRKLKLEGIIERIEDQIVVGGWFGKVNILYKGHLNGKSNHQGENTDFEICILHDLDGCDHDTDAHDIIDNPVFIWEVVPYWHANSNQQANDV